MTVKFHFSHVAARNLPHSRRHLPHETQTFTAKPFYLDQAVKAKAVKLRFLPAELEFYRISHPFTAPLTRGGRRGSHERPGMDRLGAFFAAVMRPIDVDGSSGL